MCESTYYNCSSCVDSAVDPSMCRRNPLFPYDTATQSERSATPYSAPWSPLNTRIESGDCLAYQYSALPSRPGPCHVRSDCQRMIPQEDIILAGGGPSAPAPNNITPASSTSTLPLYKLSSSSHVVTSVTTAVKHIIAATVEERTINCGQCHVKFTGQYRRGNLARHVKHKHGKTKILCTAPGCVRVFARSDARLKHERHDHPEIQRELCQKKDRRRGDVEISHWGRTGDTLSRGTLGDRDQKQENTLAAEDEGFARYLPVHAASAVLPSSQSIDARCFQPDLSSYTEPSSIHDTPLLSPFATPNVYKAAHFGPKSSNDCWPDQIWVPGLVDERDIMGIESWMGHALLGGARVGEFQDDVELEFGT